MSQCQGWGVPGSGCEKSKGRERASGEGGRGVWSGTRRRGDSHNHLAGHGEELEFFLRSNEKALDGFK